MSENWKEVTKEEFEDYVAKYPRKLEANVARMCEPPVRTYNDFSLGKWPDSAVAKIMLYDGSEYHRGQMPTYHLKTP